MAILAERLLFLGVGGFLILWLWQRYLWQRQQEQLETTFYHLLEHQKGKITLIQLVAKSRIDPEVARSFLREKAQLFGAVLESDPQGHDYYQFPPI